MQKSKKTPVGANPKISEGYAMLEQPDGLSQTLLHVSGSAHPTVSEKDTLSNVVI